MKIYVSILLFGFTFILGATEEAANILVLGEDESEDFDKNNEANDDKNTDLGVNDDVNDNLNEMDDTNSDGTSENISNEPGMGGTQPINNGKDSSDADFSWYNKVNKFFKNKNDASKWREHISKTPWLYDDGDDEPIESLFPGYDQWDGTVNGASSFIPQPNGLYLDDDSDNDKKHKINKIKLAKLSGKADEEENSNKMSSDEVKRYKDEIRVGDLTQLYGTNLHIYQPSHYRLNDLGRRFSVQYLNKDRRHNNLRQNGENNDIIPVRAPPELVLAVAKESAKAEAAKPVDPNEYINMQNALRSGNYWNSFWKEDNTDPTSALRSAKPDKKMESLRVNLSPGSPIYDYVSKLNKVYPKLLYVVNKKE